jgi:hypothetical protein
VKSAIASFTLVAALACAARADDTRQKVKPRTTVEVLDDKAQIDDVISRLRSAPPVDKTAEKPLRDERPPLPEAVNAAVKKAPPAVDPKGDASHWRRPHQRGGNNERTERPRTRRP